MITCTFENGSVAKKGLRHVTVCTLVLNEKKQILLVKRGQSVPRSNHYALPGGYLDRGETTAEAGLRELKEETGLSGKIGMLFHLNDNPNRPHEDRQNVDIIYVVTDVFGNVSVDAETTSVEWFAKDALPNDELFAYDHKKVIQKYFAYLENPFPLPLLGAL